MQSVRGEHSLSPLVAHQREQIDPLSASALGLDAGCLVEPLDLVRDGRHIAETGTSGRERPVRLRQRDHPRTWCIGADALVDRAELATVTIVARSLNDVVRADEQGDERRTERRDQGQLVTNEVVGRVSIHGGIG